MPLKNGHSDKTVKGNIRTEVHQFERTGRIGTSRPASKKAAVKQAVAIALSKAGKSRTQKAPRAGRPTRSTSSPRRSPASGARGR
jgi:hypothetical protein